MKTIEGYQISQFLRKARRLKKNLQKDTQQLRQKLLADLEAMFDIAKKAATDPQTKPKQTQIWVRIMGYLGQVMNSISESFDEAKALEYFENLERMVREAEGTQTESGTA